LLTRTTRALAAGLLLCACATTDAGLAAWTGPTWEVIVEEDLVYASPGGDDLHADVHRPDGVGPFPAVLFVHGGGWYGGRREKLHRAAMRLAHAGYVGVSVDYRKAPGATFPAPVEDLRDALVWMQQHADEWKLDPTRIGAWGYSAGAQLVGVLALTPRAGAGAHGVPKVRAVVAGGTPSDLVAFDNVVVRGFLGGSQDEIPDRYRAASPARLVTRAAPPFFVYHGRKDQVVPFEQAELLGAALRRAAVPHELFERPGGHIDTLYDDEETTLHVLEFLARWL
jgi:acetyl esterase/lipase